jgi:hypothetical protein
MRARVLSVAVAAIAAVATLVAVAGANQGGPAVPDSIAVEAGHKVFLVGHASGVQIYSCNAAGAGFAWSLVAPRADLLDDSGKLVATHSGGPTWTARDGSYVKAQRAADPVIVDMTAIPWLLLKRTTASAGPDGDRLAATTFIQRVATRGGLAPAAARCNLATAGTQEEVPYTADYYFWKSTAD